MAEIEPIEIINNNTEIIEDSNNTEIIDRRKLGKGILKNKALEDGPPVEKIDRRKI